MHGFVLGFANTTEAAVTPAVRRLARAIRASATNSDTDESRSTATR